MGIMGDRCSEVSLVGQLTWRLSQRQCRERSGRQRLSLRGLPPSFGSFCSSLNWPYQLIACSREDEKQSLDTPSHTAVTKIHPVGLDQL